MVNRWIVLDEVTNRLLHEAPTAAAADLWLRDHELDPVFYRLRDTRTDVTYEFDPEVGKWYPLRSRGLVV